jgi:hypothetical protein
VPDRIIDVMVALSYPTAFAVRPSSTAPGLLTSDEPGGAGRAGGFGFADVDGLNCAPFNFSLYGWDTCSPFSNGGFGMLGSRYSPYGFMNSRYGGAIDYLGYGGLGYGGYGSGWYLASEPSVIVLNPGNTGSGQHGQVVNGRGYTEGNSGGSTAMPISSGSSSSGGSSSGGSGATSSPSGGGDSGGGRTAVPR